MCRQNPIRDRPVTPLHQGRSHTCTLYVNYICTCTLYINYLQSCFIYNHRETNNLSMPSIQHTSFYFLPSFVFPQSCYDIISAPDWYNQCIAYWWNVCTWHGNLRKNCRQLNAFLSTIRYSTQYKMKTHFLKSEFYNYLYGRWSISTSNKCT